MTRFAQFFIRYGENIVIIDHPSAKAEFKNYCWKYHSNRAADPKVFQKTE